MTVLSWILSHKLLLFFICGASAFGIATIALAVDNDNLRSEIKELEKNASSTPGTTITSTTSTTTTSTTTTSTTTTSTTTPTPPTTTTTGTSTTTETPIDMSKYRLPTNIIPSVYDLYLYPDLNTGLFKGKVIISISVSSESNELVLHNNLLNIDNVTIGGIDGKVALDASYELLTITKSDGSPFTTNDASVEINFNGDMKNRIVGLYTSTYTNSSGVSTTIATSKFEPTYARQAFPCFDEPNMKAKYIVHLLKPKANNYIALSNYPVASTQSYDDENELVTFEETVSMSTYLSCFIVSDFTYTETNFTNDGVQTPLKVYASPENLEKTTYAGEVGKAAIEYYVNYFNIPYPLPKLDMVAIPDFVSGAMEHWGLVTYRETALLYTSTTHSSANKQRITTVVAHELAHSWFGNLVTMDWWNDLWLNEGFATYIQYKGSAAAEPDWEMMTQFLTSTLHTALSVDSALSSHPIVQTVITPDQITAIFDSISYNKGGSILRMLEDAVGATTFQTGVTNYLKKYAYSNAVTKNFLDEIEAAFGGAFNVSEMMDTFTVQMGYPVINVVFDSANNSYTLTQKRFLKDPDATYNATESNYQYKWTVPVTYVTDLGKTSQPVIFSYNQDSITIKRPENAKWLKFNYDQVGFYRVNYEESVWRSLNQVFSELSLSDRTHLLEESFALAEAGLLSYEIPLDMTNNLVNESGYTTWTVASSKLKAIIKYLNGSEQEANFKSHISTVSTNAYNNLSWTESDSDSHLTRLTRVEILSLACTVGHQECLTEAQTKFDSWINGNESLSQDLRGLVYIYGMKNATEEIFDKLLERFIAENDATEKLKLVYGLASVENTTLLNRLLELSTNESIVRSQDYFTVVQYISINKYGTSLVWDYVRENWEALVARFTLNDRYLGSLIPAITSSFSTQERLDEMETFFAKYPNAGAGESNRKTAVETVKNNIRWLAKYKTDVETWVKNANES